MPYASNDAGGFDGNKPVTAENYPQFVGKTMGQIRAMAPWAQLPQTGHDDAVFGASGSWETSGAPSLTGLQTAARPPVRQPAPTGNPIALPQIEGPGMMQSQGGSSATALSAAATTAIGGGATPAAQAAQAATPPSVAPPPATPTPPAAPAPVQSAQKFRSKSSLAGLKRAGRRAY